MAEVIHRPSSGNQISVIWVKALVTNDSHASTCAGCAFVRDSHTFCKALSGPNYEKCADKIAIEDTPEARAAYVRIRLAMAEKGASWTENRADNLTSASFVHYHTHYDDIAM